MEHAVRTKLLYGIKIQGSSVSARRVTDGREISRDASQFRLANTLGDEHGPQRDDGRDDINREDTRVD